MRKGIFAKTLKKIDDYNKNDNDQNGDGLPDIQLRVNWMADLTEEEKYGSVSDLNDLYLQDPQYIQKLSQHLQVFTEQGVDDMHEHLGSKHPLVKQFFNSKVATSIDWRDYDAVTQVHK